LKILAPIFIIVLLLVFISNVSQFGFISVPLKFDLEKLDPIKGLKGIFSFKKLIEALKLTLKLSLIVVVMTILFMLTYKEFLVMMDQDTEATIATIIQLSFYFLATILFIIIIFAIIDYYFTRHYYMKSLRMSKQDILFPKQML
jgi:flagellar biosynthetic protein FlhB